MICTINVSEADSLILESKDAEEKLVSSAVTLCAVRAVARSEDFSVMETPLQRMHLKLLNFSVEPQYKVESTVQF